MKMIFESQEPITLISEDIGCAMLVDDGEPEIVGEPQNTMWVRIGSWDNNGRNAPHADIKKLLGKRVRVTIEVIDE